MGDWATRQAMLDREAEKKSTYSVEKGVKEAQLKDARGLELFEKLIEWMKEQAESYNSQMTRKLLDVTGRRVSAQDVHLVHSFTVSRADNHRSPLKISYIPASRHIVGKCAAGLKEYSLVIREDGDVHFETRYKKPRTIEQLGEELLDHWQSVTI